MNASCSDCSQIEVKCRMSVVYYVLYFSCLGQCFSSQSCMWTVMHVCGLIIYCVSKAGPLWYFNFRDNLCSYFFFLSFSYREVHATFICQCWGLPHRLAQCAPQVCYKCRCSMTPSCWPNDVCNVVVVQPPFSCNGFHQPACWQPGQSPTREREEYIRAKGGNGEGSGEIGATIFTLLDFIISLSLAAHTYCMMDVIVLMYSYLVP